MIKFLFICYFYEVVCQKQNIQIILQQLHCFNELIFAVLVQLKVIKIQLLTSTIVN